MKPKQPGRGLAEFLLITVTIFWGGTFPLVKEAIADLPVMAFLWVRFALAALLLALLAGPKLRTLDRRGVKRGVFLGTLLFLSYLFQTWGLDRTTSANTGFLTGLNVVWVPLLAGPLLQKPPAFGAKVGVGLAFLGLFLLTYQSPWHLNPGDVLVFICSLFVALHILGLDAWTGGYNGLALTCVQITTMAVLGFIGSFFFEPVTWPRVWDQQLIVALVVCSLFATVYAFWVMTTFQRLTTPTRAALICTLEPVFAAIASVWLLAEQLTALAWCGGGLIVLGMLVAETWPLISKKLASS